MQGLTRRKTLSNPAAEWPGSSPSAARYLWAIARSERPPHSAPSPASATDPRRLVHSGGRRGHDAAGRAAPASPLASRSIPRRSRPSRPTRSSRTRSVGVPDDNGGTSRAWWWWRTELHSTTMYVGTCAPAWPATRPQACPRDPGPVAGLNGKADYKTVTEFARRNLGLA